MVLDHLFVIQRLLLKECKECKRQICTCFCISFSHWVHACANLGFSFVVIHLVVHTWSRSPTPRGLDWIDASEVSAPEYFMENYLDIRTCRGSMSTL